MVKKLYVTKASGDQELFSMNKFKRSLRRTGATRADIDQVAQYVLSHAHSGMNTSEIYRMAFDYLQKVSKSYAARYSLKRSIFALGPTGFPFEQYVAALLAESGYRIYTNQVFEGECITHEVDVVAERPEHNEHAIVEVKFHMQGRKTTSKDALYTWARFLDIQSEWVAKRKRGAKPQGGELQSWLITNTKVTRDAEKYAACKGIKIMAWENPVGQNLQNLIDHKGLYPVTCLTTLSKAQKSQLISLGYILCKDLLDTDKPFNSLKVSKVKKEAILHEVLELCGKVYE